MAVNALNGIAIDTSTVINDTGSLASVNGQTIAGGGFSFLIDEDFEGAGTPAGWSTTGSGSADFDSTVSPLAGAQSLRMDGDPDNIAAIVTVSEAEIFWKFQYRPGTLPASPTDIPLIYDVSFNEIAKISIHTTGQLIAEGGTIFEITADSMSAGTKYWVWGHYKKGTGANAVLECGFSTADDGRPTTGGKYAGASNGTQTADTELFVLFSKVNVADFDEVQIATTTFA